jgi:hypothetical protein
VMDEKLRQFYSVPPPGMGGPVRQRFDKEPVKRASPSPPRLVKPPRNEVTTEAEQRAALKRAARYLRDLSARVYEGHDALTDRDRQIIELASHARGPNGC